MYEIARQEEKIARENHERTLTISSVDANDSTTRMSAAMDADGYSVVSCRSGSPSLKAPPHKPKDGTRVNLFTESFLNAGEDEQSNMMGYALDPSARQPTKKAFLGEGTPSVTAASSTSTAASPARVSIYTNKRAAMASPAKSGPERQPSKGFRVGSTKSSTSIERKNEFDRTLEEVERSREDEEAVRSARMAPLEKLVDNKERRSDAKEVARATRIGKLGDRFYKAAREKVDKERAPDRGVQSRGGEEEEEEIDFADGDTGGIYSREHGEDDESYSYHESEASVWRRSEWPFSPCSGSR
jgi:hypothetical protein